MSENIVNTVTARFNTVTGQMTEMSQRKNETQSQGPDEADKQNMRRSLIRQNWLSRSQGRALVM